MKQQDEVGSILRRHQLVEGGLLRPDLRVVRKVQSKDPLEELRRQRLALPEELDQHLVQRGGHGAASCIRRA